MSLTLARPAARPPSAIARLLDIIRAQSGLTGADIANIAGVSPATVSRWGAERFTPHPRAQLLLAELRYIADRLALFYTPEEARLWLYARHPLLDGARPVDLIAASKAEPVLDVIDSLDSGAFT